MADNKLHTSIFGYKKQDVHEYIMEMSSKCESRVDKFKEESLSIKDEMVKEKNKAAAELDAKSKEISELKNSMKNETEKYDDIIKSCNEKIENLTSIIKQHEIDEKAISDALITAKKEADCIVKEAKSEVSDIMQKLHIDKEEQMHIAAIDMENAKREIANTTNELVSLKEQVMSAMNKYKSELEYIISEYKI